MIAAGLIGLQNRNPWPSVARIVLSWWLVVAARFLRPLPEATAGGALRYDAAP
jgi:hypothetical protein